MFPERSLPVKRKQFASLMIRLLTAVQQGSLVCLFPECSLNVP
jgi:hypothetical protein